jgi:hypothetical protein
VKWAPEADETTCGPGSTMAATRAVRAWLPGVLKRLAVKRLLDAPCGDRNWIRSIDLPCAYVGADEEPLHVERARTDGAEVLLCDIREDALPACDAILARDFLQHLSVSDEAKAMTNFRKTGAQWLVATCHGKDSADVTTGGASFRFVNMTARMGEPLDSVSDGKHGRILGVWALQ